MDFCTRLATYLTGSSSTSSTNLASTSELAAEVLDVLYSAEKKGKALEHDLDQLVNASGWTEDLASAILSALENAIKNGKVMGTAMKEAFDRAVTEATEFAKDRPIFCTVIALGILVCLVPWVLEAAGFAEAGIVEGSSFLDHTWHSLI